jgi:transcriptional regulator with XRE-family HTH domain
MADFGGVLRSLRLAAELTQEGLAEASGVSVEAIGALEGGRRRYPRLTTIDLLADGLRLDEAGRKGLAEAAARPKKAVPGGVPRELPADIPDFTGREEQLASLTSVMSGTERRGVLVISAIAGMGGVGKTALAVHLGHALADQYPDGQLYLNLRGFGPGEPLTSLEALSQLMQSLGLSSSIRPRSVAEAASRFRTALADRRVLLVLDNAASVAQVIPLLPGTETCRVLVTSRRNLTALPGARQLNLDVLPDDEALALFAAAAGGARILAETDAALAVIRLCGSLPLALRIAGAQLAAQPGWTVEDLRLRLADEHQRLDLLSRDDLSVRASITISLANLTAAETSAGAVFPLLGAYAGDVLDLLVAARLVDLPVHEIEPLLERLVDLHLLEMVGVQRYRFHDLVRAYAAELATHQFDAAERSAAQQRVLEFYEAMAWRQRTLYGEGEMMRQWTIAHRPSIDLEVDSDQLLSWFDTEIEEVLAATRRAVNGPAEQRQLLARIAVGLDPYWTIRRRYPDSLAMFELAGEADRTVRDPFARAVM